MRWIAIVLLGLAGCTGEPKFKRGDHVIVVRGFERGRSGVLTAVELKHVDLTPGRYAYKLEVDKPDRAPDEFPKLEDRFPETLECWEYELAEHWQR